MVTINRLLKLALVANIIMLASCASNERDFESFFIDSTEEPTQFDAWLTRHFVEPYNIRFEYRMPDRETNFNYWVSPPPIDKSIEVAKLIEYTTLDAMNEMMSSGKADEDPLLFVKTYFPKVLFLVGSFEISNTGATNLASAENGLQINILGVKFFDRAVDSERIAETMLHEFTHILDGTHSVPNEFSTISESDYVGNRYTSMGNDYLQSGFLSNYARSSVGEDIAVTVSMMIAKDDQMWNTWLNAAGNQGRAKIEKKVSILNKWLMDSFGVDSDKWRDIYIRRLGELNSIDWNNLDN